MHHQLIWYYSKNLNYTIHWIKAHLSTTKCFQSKNLIPSNSQVVVLFFQHPYFYNLHKALLFDYDLIFSLYIFNFQKSILIPLRFLKPINILFIWIPLVPLKRVRFVDLARRLWACLITLFKNGFMLTKIQEE